MFSDRIAIRLPASFMITSLSGFTRRLGEEAAHQRTQLAAAALRAHHPTLVVLADGHGNGDFPLALLAKVFVLRHGSTSRQIYDHGFYLGILLDAFVPAFAPQPRLLEASERDLVGVAGGVVGPDQAVLELLGHAHEARHVLRVEVRGEPELGGVGAADDFLL